MKTIRKYGVVRVLLWLVIFVSHINIAIVYIAPANKYFQVKKYANEYIVSSSDITILADKAKNEKNYSFQLLLCFVLMGTLLFKKNSVSFYKSLSYIYDCIVKVFKSSPSYLFNKVLLI